MYASAVTNYKIIKTPVTVMSAEKTLKIKNEQKLFAILHLPRATDVSSNYSN